ncbi:MAG: DLW-39 family protein [Angustibacter sp.]
MKKLLVVMAAAAGAFAVWRKMESDKAEQDLWAQATDPV